MAWIELHGTTQSTSFHRHTKLLHELHHTLSTGCIEHQLDECSGIHATRYCRHAAQTTFRRYGTALRWRSVLCYRPVRSSRGKRLGGWQRLLRQQSRNVHRLARSVDEAGHRVFSRDRQPFLRTTGQLRNRLGRDRFSGQPGKLRRVGNGIRRERQVWSGDCRGSGVRIKRMRGIDLNRAAIGVYHRWPIRNIRVGDDSR